MKATIGSTYAQIQHGKCHWLFTSTELPEWNNDQCPAVDVTGNVPEVGDVWNGVSFEKPVPPEPVPPPVPEEVSYFQGCATLMQAGLLDDVEAYMAATDTDPFEKLAWKSITVIRRHSEITEKLGAILGLTGSQIDDLFIFAASIQV